MKSIIKMLGLAFFATLAFSAIGALGAGSASALLFLTLSGGELLFEIKSLLHFNKVEPPHPTLLSSIGNVECELLLGRGAILHKTDEARKIRLEFHRCRLQGTMFPCTTRGVTGEKEGLIITLLLKALLVTLLEVRGQETKYALKIESEEGAPHLATFECLGETIVVQGSVVGDFEESLTQSQTLKKEAALLFGKFVAQDFWTLRNGIGEAHLTASNPRVTALATEDALVDIRANDFVRFDHN
jgi:hypothetical protein